MRYAVGLDISYFQEAFESSSVSVVREFPARSVLPLRFGQTSKPLNIHGGFLKQA